MEGTKIVIYLRDLNNCKLDAGVEMLLVEVKKESRHSAVNINEALSEFTKKVRRILPLQTKNADIYIGIWGGQFDFELPKGFVALLHETGLKTTIDVND